MLSCLTPRQPRHTVRSGFGEREGGKGGRRRGILRVRAASGCASRGGGRDYSRRYARCGLGHTAFVVSDEV